MVKEEEELVARRQERGAGREETGLAILPPAWGLFWGRQSRFPQNKPDYCLRKDDSQFPPREIDKAGTTPPYELKT